MRKLEKSDLNGERMKEENRRVASELRWAKGEVRRLTQAHKHQSSQFIDLKEQVFRLRSEMDHKSSELATTRKDASELAMRLCE